MTDLRPGPALDAAVGERCGLEPRYYASAVVDGRPIVADSLTHRSLAQLKARHQGCEWEAWEVWPPYSTDDGVAVKRLLPWVKAQGYIWEMTGGQADFTCQLSWPVGSGWDAVDACALSLAEALCRAVLALPEEGG